MIENKIFTQQKMLVKHHPTRGANWIFNISRPKTCCPTMFEYFLMAWRLLFVNAHDTSVTCRSFFMSSTRTSILHNTRLLCVSSSLRSKRSAGFRHVWCIFRFLALPQLSRGPKSRKMLWAYGKTDGNVCVTCSRTWCCLLSAVY